MSGEVAFVFAVLVLVVLFTGDPNLHGGLVSYFQCGA